MRTYSREPLLSTFRVCRREIDERDDVVGTRWSTGRGERAAVRSGEGEATARGEARAGGAGKGGGDKGAAGEADGKVAHGKVAHGKVAHGVDKDDPYRYLGEMQFLDATPDTPHPAPRA